MRNVLIAMTLVAASLAAAEDNFQIRANDRVVFYGDSITDSSQYSNYTEILVLTRYPSYNVRFWNSGVGGDRVSGGWMGPINDRLPRDLFSYKPTVYTIMLGMNDASYTPFTPKIFEAYTSGYEHIIREIKQKAPGARGWLIRPSPYDDVTRNFSFEGGYNAVLLKYADYVSGLAQKNQLGIVDFNAPLVETVQAAVKINPTVAKEIIPDRVHPSNAGHAVMAWNLFKAWGGKQQISSVSVDVSKKTATTANAKITDLVASSTGAGWREMEDALPFYFDRNDQVVRLTLQATKLDEQMNSERVQVLGLIEGTYQLKVDGLTIGKWTASDLASGVNIGNLDTPMTRQSAKVTDLTWKRAEIQKLWWREVQYRMQGQTTKNTSTAIRGLQALENDFIAKQHEAAKPVWHKYEVVRQ